MLGWSAPAGQSRGWSDEHQSIRPCAREKVPSPKGIRTLRVHWHAFPRRRQTGVTPLDWSSMEIWNAREAHTRPIQRMSDLCVWLERVIKQMQHLQLPSVAWLQHCPDSAIPGDVSPRDQSYWILTCLVAILLAFFRECRWCFQHIFRDDFSPPKLREVPNRSHHLTTWRKNCAFH